MCIRDRLSTFLFLAYLIFIAIRVFIFVYAYTCIFIYFICALEDSFITYSYMYATLYVTFYIFCQVRWYKWQWERMRGMGPVSYTHLMNNYEKNRLRLFISSKVLVLFLQIKFKSFSCFYVFCYQYRGMFPFKKFKFSRLLLFLVFWYMCLYSFYIN